MKKNLLLFAIVAAVAIGCVAQKHQVVTGSGTTGDPFTTNTVWQVNTNNLLLDSAILSVGTSVAVNTAINGSHNDPGVIAALKNAQVGLGGILNGTNPQTTAQVVEILKAQGNPALVQQVTDMTGAISGLEQQLLAKYGVTVAGQISVALTKAVYSGLTVGLAGH